MQFVPISFGDLNLVFPDSVSVTKDFTFFRPANTAEAVLQGFDLEYDDPDHHLRRIKVALKTHFHPGDQGGSVEIAFSLIDNSHEIISGQVDLLVIGL
jgi:hypothetical protein